MSSARRRRAGELVVPGLACALAGLTLIHGCRRQTQPRGAEPIDAAPNPSVAASVVEEEERPKGNLAFRHDAPLPIGLIERVAAALSRQYGGD